MKVTKYPQSCMMIEDSARLLIDPGTIAMDCHAVDDFDDFQAVLHTHRHVDHLDERQINALLERGVAGWSCWRSTMSPTGRTAAGASSGISRGSVRLIMTTRPVGVPGWPARRAGDDGSPRPGWRSAVTRPWLSHRMVIHTIVTHRMGRKARQVTPLRR